ncbi:restriction endonuclease subunit S [Plantactinospora sp. B5E13]|uniref:restriction endonuclease subunit S n=1 Tax=Plantactinospora sp. B5E13 TaxID=3153758 RepID=UPI00325DAF1C
MLAEVASINPRPKSRPDEAELISFIPMSAVDAETGVTASGEDRPFGDVKTGYTIFQNRDLLLAKITPCFENGKIAQAHLSRDVGVGSTEFHVIRPNPANLESRYLLHFLRQGWVRRLGERRMTGSAGQRRVPESFIAGLKIPVPSLREQQEIAELLDRADALRTRRREGLALLDELARSVFTEVVGDSVTNPRGWDDSCRLGDVAAISSGITKGRDPGSTSLRTVPYLAVLNVQDRRLDLSTVKHIEATEAEIARYRLVSGDLLLTEGGDPDKLGRGCLWNDELPEAIHQNHIFRVRVTDRSRVIPVYLNWLVSSLRGKLYFLRSAKQTTGIASINATQLKQFPLLLPPIEIQKEFADRLAHVERLRAAYGASLTKMDELFASLQDRAFRGEL